MASTINASSSGSGGLISTGDASGVLQLQNNGTVAVAVDGGNTYINCTSTQIPTVGTGRLNVNGNQGVYISGYGDGLGFGSVFKQSASASGNLGWPLYFVNSSETNIGGVRQQASSLEYRTANGAAGAYLLNSGVYFPASQVASGDANVLDDYEEGTFTPYLSDGTNSVALGNGWYTKIGRMVYVEVQGYNTNYSSLSASGGLRITSLPFASPSGINSQFNLATNNTSTYSCVGELGSSSTTAFVYLANSTVDYTSATRNNLVGGASTFSFRTSFFYFST